MEDTICAIATLVGESSINVIRVSGKLIISKFSLSQCRLLGKL